MTEFSKEWLELAARNNLELVQRQQQQMARLVEAFEQCCPRCRAKVIAALNLAQGDSHA